VAYYPYGVSTTDIKINGGTNLLVANVGDIETPMKIYYQISKIKNKDLTLSLNEDKILNINVE